MTSNNSRPQNCPTYGELTAWSEALRAESGWEPQDLEKIEDVISALREHFVDTRGDISEPPEDYWCKKVVLDSDEQEQMLAITNPDAFQQSRADLPDLSVFKELDVQLKAELPIAREKQQQELAAAILQSGAKLLVNAKRANVAVPETTPEGTRVTKLDGQNYSTLFFKDPDGNQKLAVICRKTKGIAVSVNGALKKSENLTPQDAKNFDRYANLPPQQLRASIGKAAEAERG